MRKYKATAILCCALLCILLAGCQLAKENAGMNTYEDKLIGVFVTREYIDLFNFEAYLNDNIKDAFSGGMVIQGDRSQYEGRLYATLVKKELTNEETGEPMETEEYVFEGVEGFGYFAPTVPATETQGSYVSTISDEAISDGHMELHAGGEKSSVTMEGTIYVFPAANSIFYFNPVYQSADGGVYLLSGTGMSMAGDVSSEGMTMSQTMDAEYTATENGKTKTDSTSIKINICTMLPAEEIVLLQMDEESRLLSREAHRPSTLPEAILPAPGAAYLIVETHKQNVEGGGAVAREIYGREDEAMEIFTGREDGVCVKRAVPVQWN